MQKTPRGNVTAFLRIIPSIRLKICERFPTRTLYYRRYFKIKT